MKKMKKKNYLEIPVSSIFAFNRLRSKNNAHMSNSRDKVVDINNRLSRKG